MVQIDFYVYKNVAFLELKPAKSPCIMHQNTHAIHYFFKTQAKQKQGVCVIQIYHKQRHKWLIKAVFLTITMPE